MAPDALSLALEGVRLASCLAFLVVAAVLLRKEVSPEARHAQEAFAVWWAGLALVGVLSIPTGLGVPVASAGLAATRFYLYLLFGLLFLSFAGITVYLGYLYSGRHLWKQATGFSLFMLGFLVYLVEAHQPSVATVDGTATLVYAVPQPDWAIVAFGLLLVAPMLGGALAYCALFFRVPDEHVRLRIVLVGFGILLWFAHGLTTTVLSFLADVERDLMMSRVIGQLLGIAAAAVIAWAVLPTARRTGTAVTN